MLGSKWRKKKLSGNKVFECNRLLLQSINDLPTINKTINIYKKIEQLTQIMHQITVNWGWEAAPHGHQHAAAEKGKKAEQAWLRPFISSGEAWWVEAQPHLPQGHTGRKIFNTDWSITSSTKVQHRLRYNNTNWSKTTLTKVEHHKLKCNNNDWSTGPLSKAQPYQVVYNNTNWSTTSSTEAQPHGLRYDLNKLPEWLQTFGTVFLSFIMLSSVLWTETCTVIKSRFTRNIIHSTHSIILQHK